MGENGYKPGHMCCCMNIVLRCQGFGIASERWSELA